MDAVTDHLREYYKLYIAAAVCLIPILVVFRKYTVPAILYGIELSIYAAIMHVVIHFVALLAAWFKDQSTMKRAQGLLGQDFNPGWDSPLLEFWKRKEYTPEWLFYFEVAVVVVIVLLMWRYRPLRMRRPQKKSAAGKKKPGYNYRKVK